MKCPLCKTRAETIDSRPTQLGETYRRKKCRNKACSFRFSTVETIESSQWEDAPKAVMLKRIRRFGPKTINALLHLTHRAEENLDENVLG